MSFYHHSSVGIIISGVTGTFVINLFIIRYTLSRCIKLWEDFNNCHFEAVMILQTFPTEVVQNSRQFYSISHTL